MMPEALRYAVTPKCGAWFNENRTLLFITVSFKGKDYAAVVPVKPRAYFEDMEVAEKISTDIGRWFAENGWDAYDLQWAADRVLRGLAKTLPTLAEAFGETNKISL